MSEPNEQLTPLSLIVNRNHLDFIMESAFIRDWLLGGLQRPWRYVPIESGQSVPIIGNSLYLSLYDDLVPAALVAVAKGCRNVGVLHLGDETGVADHSWYAEMDYVLRHYWHADAFRLPAGARCREVLWLANGYRYGIGPRPMHALRPSSARSIPLFFAGFVTTQRRAMLDAIAIGDLPAKVVSTDGWAKGLGAASYGAYLEDTRYALVPPGNGDETIRLFDALECGAIPVSLRHPFLQSPQAMLGCPLVMLDSWEQLPRWYAEASRQPAAVTDGHQRRVLQWWNDFKAMQQCRITSLIEGCFEDAAGYNTAVLPPLPS